MAFEGNQPVKLQGAVAGADLTATTTQYKFVKYNATDNQVVLCTATTDIPCGVLQAPAPSSATGTPVEVVSVGVTKVLAGATLTSGMTIGTDASGQARNNIAGTDTTKYIVGQLMSAGGAVSGGFATAIINCASPARAA